MGCLRPDLVRPFLGRHLGDAVAGASAVGAAALPERAGASAGAGSAGVAADRSRKGATSRTSSQNSAWWLSYVQGMVSPTPWDQVIAQINQRVGSGTVLKATTAAA